MKITTLLPAMLLALVGCPSTVATSSTSGSGGTSGGSGTSSSTSSGAPPTTAVTTSSSSGTASCTCALGVGEKALPACGADACVTNADCTEPMFCDTLPIGGYGLDAGVLGGACRDSCPCRLGTCRARHAQGQPCYESGQCCAGGACVAGICDCGGADGG